MPLFAAAVIAYAAGLLLGFAGQSLWALAAAAAGAVWWAWHRAHGTLPALALLLAAGALVARSAARDDTHCLGELTARRAIRVELAGPAEPGALARARATACRADVAVAVEHGSAPAGARVTVSGDLLRSRRGILVQHAVVRAPAPGARLIRWREAAGRRVDVLFGADAPLARALLVADRGGVPAAMRDRYAAAGLAHMLSISGLHVALIAMAVLLALQLVRVPRPHAEIATLVVIAGYVAMLGAPPPALRAAVMLGALVLSRRWQRPVSPWSVLAIGAALPLADPRVVLAVGYQLSVGGVAALIAAGRLTARWPVLHAGGVLRRGVAGVLLASTMATVVTAPLVAWSFGRLSLIGPLTNVFAAPVIAVAQPTMFLALALSPLPFVARLLADAAHPLLAAFDFIATTAAGVPGASVIVGPTRLAAAAGVAFSVALVVACVSRYPGRAMLVAAAALAAVVWAPFAVRGSGRTELHMIDVGQGDAIALRTARGHWVLMDAGRIWRGGDAGRSIVVPYIAHRGGRLAAFILSHPHDDHVGGASSVLRALRPRDYYDAAYTRAGAAYRASLFEARRDGVAWHRVHPGDSLVVDEATLTFLGPDSAWVSGLRDANEASAIVLVRVGDVRMLLVGDAERGEEQWLLAHEGRLLDADVLKVGHHGSITSSTDAFIAAVSPRLALVSVGAGNSYGHPSAWVMRRLTAAGAQVLRTDQLSTVVVSTDGRDLRVEAAGDDWMVDRNARSRSSQMSSGDSSPTLRRSILGFTPSASRAASPITRCVSPAGCWMSESVEPRLTAGMIIRTSRMTAAAASKPPATSNAIIAPGPRIWRPTSPSGSPPASPGK
jgi:competence protein ComEC